MSKAIMTTHRLAKQVKDVDDAIERAKCMGDVATLTILLRLQFDMLAHDYDELFDPDKTSK